MVPCSGPLATIARCEPSGDKLQLQSGSICAGAVVFPVFTSNWIVSEAFPFLLLYMQIVDGRRAHCTFQMPASLRTRRGFPPFTGIAKIVERTSMPAPLGVEIYRISEPSGVILGMESCSLLAITLSAT